MKQYRKLIVDAVMSALLLLLMAYELIGASVHEWLGIAMFVLVILHHGLNRKWSGNVLKGKYSPPRVLQTLLVVLVLFSMLGSMVSGIILSRHALAFLPIHGGIGWARTVHLLCGYWGFVLMGMLMAVYGAYTFVKRGLPDYLTLENHEECTLKKRSVFSYPSY